MAKQYPSSRQIKKLGKKGLEPKRATRPSRVVAAQPEVRGAATDLDRMIRQLLAEDKSEKRKKSRRKGGGGVGGGRWVKDPKTGRKQWKIM